MTLATKTLNIKTLKRSSTVVTSFFVHAKKKIAEIDSFLILVHIYK